MVSKCLAVSSVLATIVVGKLTIMCLARAHTDLCCCCCSALLEASFFEVDEDDDDEEEEDNSVPEPSEGREAWARTTTPGGVGDSDGEEEGDSPSQAGRRRTSSESATACPLSSLGDDGVVNPAAEHGEGDEEESVPPGRVIIIVGGEEEEQLIDDEGEEGSKSFSLDLFRLNIRESLAKVNDDDEEEEEDGDDEEKEELCSNSLTC